MTENTPAPENTTPAGPPTEAQPVQHEGLLNKVVTDAEKIFHAVETFAAEHGLDAALVAELKQVIAKVL
jgi:hypothetical protein